jgi:hypothetical protein
MFLMGFSRWSSNRVAFVNADAVWRSGPESDESALRVNAGSEALRPIFVGATAE